MSQLSHVSGPSAVGHLLGDQRYRGISVVWPLGCLVAILYGSLLPFEIDLPTVTAALNGGLANIAFHPAPLEDVLTNLLVYVPLGLLCVLCGDQRMASRLAKVPVAIFVGASVSLSAEILQVGMACRIASWNDWILNGIGTGIGALIGASAGGALSITVARTKEQLSHRPFTTVGGVLTMALLLYGVAPFDFVSSTDQLHASFVRARWDLTQARPGILGDPPLRLIVQQLMGAAWFAALGYVLALARRGEGRDPVVGFASAVKHGAILACLIESMQLFTASHTFDIASPILRALAVGLGAWCGTFMASDGHHDNRADTPARALSTGMLAMLAVGQLVLLTISSVDLATVSVASFDTGNMGWLPFEALWRRPMLSAVSWVVSSVVVFGTFAMTIGLLLRRIGCPGRWIVAGSAVLVVATALEALRLCSVMHVGDSSGPVLAVMSALLAARLAEFAVDRDAEAALVVRRVQRD